MSVFSFGPVGTRRWLDGLLLHLGLCIELLFIIQIEAFWLVRERDGSNQRPLRQIDLKRNDPLLTLSITLFHQSSVPSGSFWYLCAIPHSFLEYWLLQECLNESRITYQIILQVSSEFILHKAKIILGRQMSSVLPATFSQVRNSAKLCRLRGEASQV